MALKFRFISSVSFRPSLMVLKKYLKILMANKKLIKIYMGEELKLYVTHYYKGRFNMNRPVRSAKFSMVKSWKHGIFQTWQSVKLIMMLTGLWIRESTRHA
jgi:hypothetical protein